MTPNKHQDPNYFYHTCMYGTGTEHCSIASCRNIAAKRSTQHHDGGTGDAIRLIEKKRDDLLHQGTRSLEFQIRGDK